MTTKPLNVETMLLSDKQLAVVLSISVTHVHTLDNSGKLPKAVKLSKSKRWITTEIRDWTNAGCPERIEWLLMKKESEVNSESFQTNVQKQKG